MHIEISASLKLISNELRAQTELNGSRGRYGIFELLKTLNTNEKLLIAKFFLILPWNIGSLRVLAMLQELRLLTATEYILSCENDVDIQLILNDFLEAEYELITNIFANSTFDTVYSVRLNDILNECLKNLFNDLLKQPELNRLCFLNYLTKHVPDQILQKLINKNLEIILKLHESTITDAFGQLSMWINEGVDELKFPKDLCEKLLSNNIADALNFILKQSSEETFKNWKFYIIILQTLCSLYNDKTGPLVRKFLKLRLKQCATVPCKQTMLHILLTARASNALTMDIGKNLDNYAEWYKNNIGEMKFYLKTEEFQNVLNLLEQCLTFEKEVDYLEIHAIISISPPVLCGKLVQTYKSKCKHRLQQIKRGQTDNESIVIEDSN